VLVSFLSRHAYPFTQERDDEPGNLLGLLEPRPVTDTGQDLNSRMRKHAALAFVLLDRDVDIGSAKTTSVSGSRLRSGSTSASMSTERVDR